MSCWGVNAKNDLLMTSDQYDITQQEEENNNAVKGFSVNVAYTIRISGGRGSAIRSEISRFSDLSGGLYENNGPGIVPGENLRFNKQVGVAAQDFYAASGLLDCKCEAPALRPN